VTEEHRIADQVEQIVREAGEIIVRDAQRPRNVRHKGRIDLVTETDLRVEEKLKGSLSEVLPNAAFLAEETASKTRPEGLTWIIDPLDGTTNFAHGIPFVAISVALWSGREIVMGFVHAPLLGECFSAVRGMGAKLNGEPVSVSMTEALDQSLVATGFPYKIEDHLQQTLRELGKMLASTQGIRRPGSAALDLAYTSCGRFDGFYEAALNPWDTAAGWLLVQEAGGMVSQYDSTSKYVLGAGTILASNGRIHEQMSRLLASE
jgi:myo-inositol-1(or 4)-monophosphatase